MSTRANRIVHAWMETPTRGVCELAHDWRARTQPPLKMSGGTSIKLARVTDHSFGKESGYFVTRGHRIYFFIPRPLVPPEQITAPEAIYLAGDFNGWGEAIGREAWKLKPASLDGEPVLLWCGDAQPFLSPPGQRFKFVTQSGHWLEVPHNSSVVTDENGNRNRLIDPERSGMHLYCFTLPEPIDLTRSWRMYWQTGDVDHSVPIRMGAFFHALKSDSPMGARVENGDTVFRLFAPRATAVELCLQETDEPDAPISRYPLVRVESDDPGEASVWELTAAGNLHGWRYWYHLDGPRDEFGLFDPEQKVLDPYALASVDRVAPGIVVDLTKYPRRRDSFKTPAWQDLVICEAHVRDLAANAPTDATDEERRGFTGLLKWVREPAGYFQRLGVNCVELQPVQEFDNESPAEYHWGYMTNNYFALESSYALEPKKLSGIREFQELVAEFHRQGIAVILDVVYNHVGVPGHLMFIDKLYYFTLGGEGELTNWSGCGNDLRADAAMATRLIIESCAHLVTTFGIDGFRFDLAELLGVEVLKEVEIGLKRVKPDIILIAEPWSFRGHIAGPLAETGWASWNDGYRRFLKDLVHAKGTHESLEYYMKGSPWYFAHWPAQTVNYVESHDDRTWIDEITDNTDSNGHLPTVNDRRRTHLMAAVLFGSIGIPMISAGQDFLRSKHGINNTYRRGDINALDYRRLERFSATHAFFADWIRFRKSEPGKLLRHFSRASETFFRFWFVPDSMAVAILYNADFSQGDGQLLLAINPQLCDLEVSIDVALVKGDWIRVADHERFMNERDLNIPAPLPPKIWIPALGCSLWRRVEKTA